MLKLKRSSLFMAVTALVILAGLFLAFFHHHEHGHEHEDCAACRLVQWICALAVFTAVLATLPALSRTGWVSYEETFYALRGISALQGRAPPVSLSL